MKKIAIALVIVACLLTGALLPALAETDLSRPAAAEEPRMEEKTPGETELPARNETSKATDEREDPATPEEKPDAFEAPEPSQRHGHHGAAHPHGKRHHGGERLRPGPGADMPRRPGADERPRQAAPHCRRWCGPERSRPHCAGCPFGRECPGWENDQPAETLPAPLPKQESRQAEEPAKKTTLRLGPGMAV